MSDLSPNNINVGWKRKLGATPDGSARKERQPKESAANWLAHREPMGKRPPTGASIPNHSQIHSLLPSTCFGT